MKITTWFKLFSFTALLLLPGIGFAHPLPIKNIDFYYGFIHPFMGIDHQLAMFAVGLWSVQLGKKAWIGPLVFIGCMLIGGIVGLNQISIPLVETGVTLSLLFLGLLVASVIKSYLYLVLPIIGLFALCHGHAHGAEIPMGLSSAPYISGFVISTVCLHVMGIGVGLFFKKYNLSSTILRAIGFGIALIGSGSAVIAAL